MAPLTLNQFAAYVEDYPGASTSFWGDRSAIAMYPMLAWLNTHPVVLQREAVADSGPALGLMRTTRPHHNQVGTAVAWAARFMTGEGTKIHVDVDALPRLFDLAGRAWALRSLIAEARQGVRTFEVTDRQIRMEFVGDRGLDALDRMLDLVEEVEKINAGWPAWSARVREWFQDDDIRVPWKGTPAWLRGEFREFSAALVAAYPSFLRSDLDVGGFTMGEATEVLVELLARATYAHGCLLSGSISSKVTVPAFQVEPFARDLAKTTGIRQLRIEQILELLTLDLERCPDPCLTPLIPVGHGLIVPMSSLIVPSSPVRNFTALLQADPNRFGKAGKELGALGAKTVAQTLGRLVGALIGTGVQVLRNDRSKAGDLDVVAFDSASRTMAVFAILWRIGPDGSAEVADIEEAAHAKRTQVARVRDEIARGEASPRWPKHWPDPGGVPIRWFILSPSVLPVRRPESDGIIVRSHQMLERTLPAGSSVTDLIGLMDKPPYPPEELVESSWHELVYGEFEIAFDVSNAAPG